MPALAYPNLHRWDITPQEAIRLQCQLAQRLTPGEPVDLARISTVAGVDVSVMENHSWAAIAVLSFPALALLEVRRADIPTPFPYIPGLLAFAKGP
jgi:deoxyribonuclease V